MPETDPAPKPEPAKTDPAPKPEPPKADPAKPEPLGEGGEKALKAERARANEATKLVKDLEAKVKEYADRDKSESEKFAERLAAAEKTAADAQAAVGESASRLIRYEVAAEKELPAGLVKYVTGLTREDIEASVASVAADWSGQKPTGPKPDPSQGAGGSAVGIDEQIKAATAKGDVREVIRLKARQSVITT